MKNPLAIVVAFVLIGLGALLYVNSDKWDRWGQWASLPAEEAVTTSAGSSGESTTPTAAAPDAVAPEASGEKPSEAASPDVASAPSAAAPAVSTQAPQQQAATTPEAEPESEPKESAGNADTSEPDPSLTALADPQPTADDTEKPSFDIVRVEEDGTAVIAGRARPKATVTVMLDSTSIGEAEANERGEWVVIVDKPIAPGDHNLSAMATEPGKKSVASDQTIALALAQPGEEKPLIVATEPDKPTRVLQAPEPIAEVAEKTAEAPAAADETPAAAAEDKSEDKKDLRLETVDYNDRGEMIFSGTAPADSKVRLYVDNKHVADSETRNDGRWVLEHSGTLSSGKHSLRVDQLRPDGRVAKRIELPFERADEQMIAQLLKQRSRTKQIAEKAAPEPVKSRTPVTPPPAKVAEAPSTRSGSTASPAPATSGKSAERLPETGGGPATESSGSGAGIVGEAKNSRSPTTTAMSDAPDPQPAPPEPAPAQPAAPRSDAADADSGDSRAARQAPRMAAPATDRAPEQPPATESRIAEVPDEAPVTAPSIVTAPAEPVSPSKSRSEASPAPAAPSEAPPKPQVSAKPQATADAGQARATQPEAASSMPAAPLSSAPRTQPPAAEPTPTPVPASPATETAPARKSPEDTQTQIAVAEAEPEAEAETETQPEPEPALADDARGQVIIQPGNNLWRIARVVYGKGIQYSVIYQANQGQIRNPDLIYPGQIFNTPGATPPAVIAPSRREPFEAPPPD